MRDAKDTPLLMPLRIGSPNRLGRFSWAVVIAWYIIAAIATSFEPDPSGMGIEFHWTYVLQGQIVALLVRLALPFLLLPFRPTLPKRALLRLSIAACIVWLWTTPIAWLWHTPAGGIALTFVREAAWFSVLLAGAGLQRPKSILPRRIASPLLVLLAIVLSISIQTIPDLWKAGGLRMDNIQTGRLAAGTPILPDGPVSRARWTIKGPDDLLQPSRIALGSRQVVVASAPGSVTIESGPGFAPPPSDTSGTGTANPSEGPSLDRLLIGIPNDAPDSVRLLILHDRVHQSIRYDRRYFPGNSEEILQRGTGDCKAYAHLMTEGARRLGYRAKEVRGLLASADGYYAHAWTTIETGGRWTDWDATSGTPFPDARYLRFSTPERATSAFDGELGIFALEAIDFKALEPAP